jgi:hypothetical protein
MPGAGTRQVISATSALVLLGTISILLFCTEPSAARFWFALAVTVAITSFVSLLSRRLLFASVIASSLVAVVFLISLEKQATMNVGLHSYDLFFYLNADTLEFLWSDYNRGGIGLALRYDTTLAFGFELDLGRCDCGGGDIRASSKRSG